MPIHDPLRGHCTGDDLPDGMVKFLFGPCISGRTFRQNSFHGLEEGDIVADTQRLITRYCQRESLRQFLDCSGEAILAILLGKDVFLCARQ
jgi:hypothetical protein